MSERGLQMRDRAPARPQRGARAAGLFALAVALLAPSAGGAAASARVASPPAGLAAAPVGVAAAGVAPTVAGVAVAPTGGRDAAGTVAGVAVAPADRAATYAYLLASYRLYRALLRDGAASRAAAAGAAKQIGSECHGVLAGAPKEPQSLLSEGATPLQRGERERRKRQLQTIEQELIKALAAARYRVSGGAIEAFAAQVTHLGWSDPEVAASVRADLAGIRSSLEAPSDACADMRAWAQSGYRLLSPASREFEAAARAQRDAEASVRSVGSLLKPYEDAADRALLRRTRRLQARLTAGFTPELLTDLHTERALGLPKSPLEEEVKRGPVLGRGRTAAGTRFLVRGGSPGGLLRPHRCRREASVEYRPPSGSLRLAIESGAEPDCLSTRELGRHYLSCAQRVESITVVVPASVRTARLTLSDGRTIVSKVTAIPPKYGGPAGVYAQAVRGAYAVSLTELDAHGGVVGVVRLPKRRCRRTPPPVLKAVPLATGHTPEGEPFTIQGLFTRFAAHETNLSLSVDVGIQPFQPYMLEEAILRPERPKAYSRSLALECSPRQFTILYGVLAPPGRSVFARTPAGLVPLTKVAISPHLHAKGPLVYGVFRSPPSELVVERGDGSTLYTESLAAEATEDAEFCEGYGEG